MYADVTQDFVARTRQNLDLIRRQRARGEDAFEVTQLINSLLGLLVFPQQAFFSSIPDKPLTQLEGEGWPVPPVIGDFPDVDTLGDLVRYLRNAIAHFNIEFRPDRQGHVHAVQLWNCDRNGKETWRTELSLLELEALADKFCALLLGRDGWSEPTRRPPAGRRGGALHHDDQLRPIRKDARGPLVIDPAVEGTLLGGVLVYPACADDWRAVVTMLGHIFSEFIFLDPYRFARPNIRLPNSIGKLLLQDDKPLTDGGRLTTWSDRCARDREVHIRLLRDPGEQWLERATSIRCFFLRRDTTAPGEGSSGVAWLGRPLLHTILARMEPGGVIATDGSCVDNSSPAGLRQFYGNGEVRLGAVFRSQPFTYENRWQFACRGYAGEGIGPTLLWQVSALPSHAGTAAV